MNQKYEISEITHPRYPWLHRVRALWGFRSDVRPGDLGGYVQSEENLSQEDVCWIFDDAIACEGSFVDQQATLSGNAVARGSALISGVAMVRNNAVIDDHAIVMAGLIRDYAHVAGNAEVIARASTGVWPHIEGHASVYGDVCGGVIVKGTAVILPSVTIDNPTQDFFVVEQGKVSVERSYQRLHGIPQNPNKISQIHKPRCPAPER